MEAGCHITPLPIDGSQIDVQQVGCTVDIESACRNAVFGVVDRLILRISSAGEDKEHIVFTDCLLQCIDDSGKRGSLAFADSVMAR